MGNGLGKKPPFPGVEIEVPGAHLELEMGRGDRFGPTERATPLKLLEDFIR